MSEVLVIGEPEIVEGFSLAGAVVEVCTDPEEAAWMVSGFFKSSDHDIVVLTETLYEALPEKLRLRAEQSGRPLFITLPRPAGKQMWEEREDLIARTIRRAVGYRLKIRR